MALTSMGHYMVAGILSEKLTFENISEKFNVKRLKMTVDADKGNLETATSGQPHLAKQVSWKSFRAKHVDICRITKISFLELHFLRICLPWTWPS